MNPNTPDEPSGLTTRPTVELRGIELRYVVTLELFLHGRMTLAELARALEWHGFSTAGRPSKAISDALRWECAIGRVYRRGRGVYGPGWMPRGTEHRIHTRVVALRARADRLRFGPETGVPGPA